MKIFFTICIRTKLELHLSIKRRDSFEKGHFNDQDAFFRPRFRSVCTRRHWHRDASRADRRLIRNENELLSAFKRGPSGPRFFLRTCFCALGGLGNRSRITTKKIHHAASVHAGAGIFQSKRSNTPESFQMAKTLNITLAFLLFAPIAFAIAMQAAHIVA